jgi:hypothetical protein
MQKSHTFDLKKMTSKAIQHITNPIDAVITWVDGDCPEFKRKMESYLGGENRRKIPGAHQTRFASNNEIKYCLLSILRFAPFVRNIYIVTDGQNPPIWEEVKTYFPERLSSIKIVDHTEIFRGYEEFLPVFNSTAIESMIWRIEGISDNFVYFNDDVILIRDIWPEDWVIDGRPIIRGKWKFPPYRKLFTDSLKVFFNRQVLGNKTFHLPMSFYLRQWNAAQRLGFRFRYFFHCHTPHVINRNTLCDYFSKNSILLKHNISKRFRTKDQFITISLANHLEILAGNKNIAKLNLGYLFPANYSKMKQQRRMNRCEKDVQIKSVCIQSLDLVPPKEQEEIFRWLLNFINI